MVSVSLAVTFCGYDFSALFLLNSELLAHQTPKITKTNVQILRNILLFRNTLTC